MSGFTWTKHKEGSALVTVKSWKFIEVVVFSSHCFKEEGGEIEEFSIVVVVQLLSRVRLFVTLSHARLLCPSLSPWVCSNSVSVELVMPSNHLILCRPLLFLPSVFPSIRVFSSESALHTRCPKYWSFSFNISPANEYSGVISFRMHYFDLLAVQGISRVFSNTQFKSINSSALSFLYGPTLTSMHDY